jgi:16S rRNA G966 N2-methylase RsmD
MCIQDPIVIIDPFAGTSAVGVAALRNGAYYIGVEKDIKCMVHTMSRMHGQGRDPPRLATHIP